MKRGVLVAGQTCRLKDADGAAERMSVQSRGLVLSAAVTLTVSFVSCAKSPTSPSQGPSSPSQGMPSAPAVILKITLLAPQAIAPGESVQLTANALKSDGSVDNVTRQAEWTSRTNSVITVTGTGLATGGDPGRGWVSVRYGSFTADQIIFIVPRGTFSVWGSVMTGATGVGIENVTMTVISGVGAGLTARTDAFGSFELFGVSGSVQIRASKEGYLDQTQQVFVDRLNSGGLNFQLSVTGPIQNFAGVYGLIITGRSCSADFPEAAKRRVYTARIEQIGVDLQVTLSDADLLSGHFGGAVTAPGKIGFVISPADPWSYGGAALLERLSDGSQLQTSGLISATSTPQGISGTAHVDSPGMILMPGGSHCDIDHFDMVPR